MLYNSQEKKISYVYFPTKACRLQAEIFENLPRVPTLSAYALVSHFEHNPSQAESVGAEAPLNPLGKSWSPAI